MRFSTRTRYGVRALIDLGLYYKGRPVLVKEIAKRQGVSERYLEHIMLALKKEGFLRSIKGGKGGYALLKLPEEIKIKDVVIALEGPISPVECVERKEICERSRTCAARELWCRLRDEVIKVLERTTLKDLIERQKEKGSRKGEVPYYEI